MVSALVPRVGAAVVAALALAAPVASADTYIHDACPGELTADAAGWTAKGDRGRGVITPLACATGDGMGATLDHSQGVAVPVGDGVGWAYAAPSGTIVTGATADIRGWLAPWDGTHRGVIMIERGGAAVQAWASEKNPFLASTSGAGMFVAGIETRDLAITLRCDGAAGALPCTNWSTGWMDIRNAAVRLRDDHAPTSAPPTGTLVAQERLSGSVAVRASLRDDGGGVRELRAFVDGVPVAGRQLGGGLCTPSGFGGGVAHYRSPRPCPLAVEAELTLDTSAVADGRHTVTVKAFDASGNAVTAYSASKLVVNNPPRLGAAPFFTSPAVAAAAAPGTAIVADRGSWIGPNLTFSQQWQRCESDGSDCRDIAGANGLSYTPIDIDRGKRLRMVVTATNVAGAVSKETPLTGVVPGADGADPSSLPSTVVVVPPGGSGAGGAGGVGGAGGAGAVGRGARNGRVVGAASGDGCPKDAATLVATRYRGRVVRLRYGSRVAIRVRLTCSENGQPIAGAQLQTATLVPGRPLPAGGALTTDDRGFAVVRANSGPSRTVAIGYRMYAREDLDRAALMLRVVVRGRVTLAVRRLGGGIARFGGRVVGGHVPPRGTTIQIQWQDGARWRPVATVRTNRLGRFSYRYRFTGRGSGRIFRFRAVVGRGQTDYPFMPGRSRPVRARG